MPIPAFFWLREKNTVIPTEKARSSSKKKYLHILPGCNIPANLAPLVPNVGLVVHREQTERQELNFIDINYS